MLFHSFVYLFVQNYNLGVEIQWNSNCISSRKTGFTKWKDCSRTMCFCTKGKRRVTERWTFREIKEQRSKYIILLKLQVWGYTSNSGSRGRHKWTTKWRIELWWSYKRAQVAHANIGHDRGCNSCHIREMPQVWDGWLRLKTIRRRESLSSCIQVLWIQT